MDFNLNSMSEFMAQVQLAYDKYHIRRPWQVLNLGETGFTPGRDLTSKTAPRVVTMAGKRVPWSDFNFKYPHRISFLVCVNAAGH